MESRSVVERARGAHRRSPEAYDGTPSAHASYFTFDIPPGDVADDTCFSTN